MPEQETAGRQPERAPCTRSTTRSAATSARCGSPYQSGVIFCARDRTLNLRAVKNLAALFPTASCTCSTAPGTWPKSAIYNRRVGRERAALSPGTLARFGPS